jgi:hypothetical protein
MTQHQKMTHRATVQSLVDAIRATLGDIYAAKQGMVAQKVLARQCAALVSGDPAYVGAIRAVVEARVAGLIASPEAREKILDDPGDPDHLYWLLTVPDALIRQYARRQAEHLSPQELFARMGPAMFGGVFRMGPGPDDDGGDEG